jgi:putative DNA primase/helicase
VHHTGKDASKGMRGHSSLHAALDGAIEVKRDVQGRQWSAAKVKDGADDDAVRFKLSVVDLDFDQDGEPITSCVVAPDTEALFRQPEPSGKNQLMAWHALKSGSPHSLSHEAAITKVAGVFVHVESHRRSTRAKEAIKGLLDGNFIHIDDEGHVQIGNRK